MRSALITGSLDGIGFANARALAGQAYDITLNAFAPAETIEARLTALPALGVRVRYHPADLRHKPQIGDLIAFLSGPHAEDINGAWTAGRV